MGHSWVNTGWQITHVTHQVITTHWPTDPLTQWPISCCVLQVYLSTRSGAWFVRRVWDNGLPLDLALVTRFKKFLVRLLPTRISASQLGRTANSRCSNEFYGLQPGHDIMSSRRVTNDDLPSRIITGSVQVRPGIASLTPHGVRFIDGTHVDNIDVIICSTGKQMH